MCEVCGAEHDPDGVCTGQIIDLMAALKKSLRKDAEKKASEATRE